MFCLYKHFICFYFILFNGIYTSYAFKCPLPERCRIESWSAQFSQRFFIICDINNNEFEFKFKESTSLINIDQKCEFEDLNLLLFRWTSNDLLILDKAFNFTNVIRYTDFFKNLPFVVNIMNIKGFDVNFLGKKFLFNNNSPIAIYIYNSRLDFYHNKKKINSCQDFVDSNITEIESIFQQIYEGNTVTNLDLINVEYKQKTCPLVFKNSRMNYMSIIELVDTFYKKSILSFSNEIDTKLNSKITRLKLFNVVNINLDLNLIHPSVFKYTNKITIDKYSLNTISGDIFEQLRNLSFLEISDVIFMKIIHKQGIKWIQQWNRDVNVNLSNIPENCCSHRELKTSVSTFNKLKMSEVFPEEDFCIYVDFPFNQMIILYREILSNNEEFTCTYFWLVQYYKNYINIYKDKISLTLDNFENIVNSSGFKSISKCNFTERINNCNKSYFQTTKDIWDEGDYLILYIKLQTAFKSQLYPTAFLGLVTNIIVVIVILKKDNADLFKGIKQYSYLWLNSIFCIMILLIELLSWMNECFYPYQVFCPETRKLVAIQLLKIILKECLVTVFRFMCNFTYIAFALNRISLIGKDHGKIVSFFSKVGIKKYILITFLISSSLSWIYYFKYSVNYYGFSEFFPTLNEILNIKNEYAKAYLILNSISSFINYFLFVIICSIIDICMVVQLRRTLEEKAKKSGSMMNQNQNETKKTENQDVVKKAIKLVVLNTTIGICFKLPGLLIPLLNLCAEFFVSSNDRIPTGFSYIFHFLHFTSFIIIIQDVANLLYTISLSIQIFIYYRFDKKFQTGCQRLKGKIITNIKSVF